ncbi:unnamed protein product [Amoebophrya sp. A120]|nr:unnamed protein product [Amoebophrya sp. A120]|eukprot:GSA120T00001582001.1
MLFLRARPSSGTSRVVAAKQQVRSLFCVYSEPTPIADFNLAPDSSSSVFGHDAAAQPHDYLSTEEAKAEEQRNFLVDAVLGRADLFSSRGSSFDAASASGTNPYQSCAQLLEEFYRTPLTNYNGLQLAEYAEAACRWRHREVGFWEDLLNTCRAPAAVDTIRPAHLVRILWACHRVDFHEVTMLDVLADRMLAESRPTVVDDAEAMLGQLDPALKLELQLLKPQVESSSSRDHFVSSHTVGSSSSSSSTSSSFSLPSGTASSCTAPRLHRRTQAVAFSTTSKRDHAKILASDGKSNLCDEEDIFSAWRSEASPSRSGHGADEEADNYVARRNKRVDPHKFFRELDLAALSQLAMLISAVQVRCVLQNRTTLHLRKLIHLAVSEREMVKNGVDDPSIISKIGTATSAGVISSGNKKQSAGVGNALGSRSTGSGKNMGTRNFSTKGGEIVHHSRNATASWLLSVPLLQLLVSSSNAAPLEQCRPFSSAAKGGKGLFSKNLLRKAANKMGLTGRPAEEKEKPTGFRGRTPGAGGPFMLGASTKDGLLKKIRVEREFLKAEMTQEANQVVAESFALRNQYRSLAEQLLDAILDILRRRHVENVGSVTTSADESRGQLREFGGHDDATEQERESLRLQQETRSKMQESKGHVSQFRSWVLLLTAVHRMKRVNAEARDIFERGAIFCSEFLSISENWPFVKPREVLQIVSIYGAARMRHERFLTSVAEFVCGSSASGAELSRFQEIMRESLNFSHAELDRIAQCRTLSLQSMLS